jgi:hypothetical protein
MLQQHNPTHWLSMCAVPCALVTPGPGGRSGFGYQDPRFQFFFSSPSVHSFHPSPAEPQLSRPSDDQPRVLGNDGDTNNSIHSILTSHIQFTSLASQNWANFQLLLAISFSAVGISTIIHIAVGIIPRRSTVPYI